MSEQIQNAKIKSTFLGVEDHGILTFWLYLEFDGSGQGFGGWALDGRPANGYGDRVPTEGCGAIVAALLNTLGVDSWEKLPGQIVRVRGDHSGLSAIGHALKDRWCVPKELFAAARSTPGPRGASPEGETE